MGCSDSDRKAVDARGLDVFLRHFRLRERRVAVNIVLRALPDMAKFCLNGNAYGMADAHDIPDARDILFKRKRGAVVHHRGEAGLNGVHDLGKLLTMVEMDSDGHTRRLSQASQIRAKKRQVRVRGIADGED